MSSGAGEGTGAAADLIYDVVIVGCGPVGVIAAHLFGAQGVRTLVVERDIEPYIIPRAVHFDHEIMRILQSAGLADDVLPLLAIPEGTVHFGMDGAPIRPFRRMTDTSAYGWAEDYFFYQPELEAVLRDRLARRPTVEVLLGHELVDLAQGNAATELTLRCEDGERRVRARYVLGCDGGRSVVRRLIGVELEDLGFDEPWIVVDVNVTGPVNIPRFSGLPDDVDVERVMFIVGDPARPTSYVPSSARHRRWEFMLLPGEDPVAAAEPGWVQRLLEPWLASGDYQLIRSSIYRFHSLIATRWREGSIFLLGDAAHQTPPFFGQGLCHGIRDAGNLAWKLGMVLRGEATPPLLDTYEVERRPHARAVIETSIRTGRYICTLDPAAAHKRDEDMRSAPSAGAPRAPLIPPLRAGIIDPAGTDPAGHRFIQPRVVTDDGRDLLLDDATGGGFVLLTQTTGELPPQAIAPFVRRFTASAGGPGAEVGTNHFRDRDGALGDWLSRYGAAGLVLRPDGYVYGIFADGVGATELLTKLEGQVSDTSTEVRVSDVSASDAIVETLTA